MRLVQYPTTSLSQGDGGVGVKNGINYFGKKNWVGTFAVPDAVVVSFLSYEVFHVIKSVQDLLKQSKLPYQGSLFFRAN